MTFCLLLAGLMVGIPAAEAAVPRVLRNQSILLTEVVPQSSTYVTARSLLSGKEMEPLLRTLQEAHPAREAYKIIGFERRGRVFDAVVFIPESQMERFFKMEGDEVRLILRPEFLSEPRPGAQYLVQGLQEGEISSCGNILREQRARTGDQVNWNGFLNLILDPLGKECSPGNPNHPPRPGALAFVEEENQFRAAGVVQCLLEFTDQHGRAIPRVVSLSLLSRQTALQLSSAIAAAPIRRYFHEDGCKNR